MAQNDQIKTLFRPHADGETSHFFAMAMQLATFAAKLGQVKLAEEIRSFVDEAKQKNVLPFSQQLMSISTPRGELSSLVSVSYPNLRLSDMVISESISKRLKRLIQEQNNINKIRHYGLSPKKKVLLVGPPGTGKTMSASVLAGELELPLLTVRLDRLMTKYMGEMAAKLRPIFESLTKTRGVYLFDEFDAIGNYRGFPNNIEEIRRTLNRFLQMTEQDTSDNLILAVTNHPDVPNSALSRRFDDIIKFELPPKRQIEQIITNKLRYFKKGMLDWKKLSENAEGLSYADITRACEEAIKDAIIHSRERISTEDLLKPLRSYWGLGI